MDLLSIAQAARYTGIHERTLRRMCARGEVPGARAVGRAWVLPRASLMSLHPRERGRPPLHKPK